MYKFDACVVVPAYNEEPVIGSSLARLCEVVYHQHIYVVSDGSKDKTAQIARQFTSNVLELQQNVGKAKALNFLIRSFHLLDRYNYVLFADADSRLSSNFMTEIKKFTIHEPACIVGTVISDRHGLISAYRTYEYGMTHRFFKTAQHMMRVITVAPGCASLYRSDVLAQLDFNNHTLTEDFDLTLQIHKNKLGNILYASKARVITQDPPTLRDYWKQIVRWYTGFWQNIYLHKLYAPNSKVNFEILLMLVDSLSWIFALGVAIMEPLLFLNLLIGFYMINTVLGCIILVLERRGWAIKYIPLFPMFQFINITAYTYSFFRATFSRSKKLSWQKVTRYSVPEQSSGTAKMTA